MAIVTDKIKVDLIIKQYGYKYSENDDPLEALAKGELTLTESRELKELSVKEVIRLLVDYLSDW